MLFRGREKWGHSKSSTLIYSPHPRIAVTEPFSSFNWFTDKAFLTQEYIEKRKSLSHIARELGCARSTVIDHLLKNGIPLRTDGLLPNYNKSQLAYGERLHNGQPIPHLGELRTIKQFQALRDEGLSFAKIAKWANEQKIPTKNKTKAWNRRTIFEILRRENNKSNREK